MASSQVSNITKLANTLDELNKSNENLVDSVCNFKEDELYILVPGKSFSFYEMLHGIPQHDHYHAGQACSEQITNSAQYGSGEDYVIYEKILQNLTKFQILNLKFLKMK